MTEAKKKLVSQRRKVEFAQFLNRMQTGEPVSLESKETAPWFEEGRIYQVSETTYMYHLEVLPPRWIEENAFGFGEGFTAFQLFWKAGQSFFGRQLTKEETFHFCRLSGTPLIE
jgi:hypothetical protein